MKLGYPITRLTPAETSFIRESLFYSGEEYDLRRRIVAAQEDWAISVAPDRLLKMLEGNENARQIANGLMSGEYRDATEESINIDLSNVELSIIRSSARFAVERAKEHAMLTDQHYDEIYNSDDGPEERLSGSDADILKSAEFEAALRDMHMGRFIIGAINEYYPE